MGISATHVVQLVAQKLINATFPLRSAVVSDEPFRSVKVLSGAAEEFMQPASASEAVAKASM
jgi:hypothetical protein